jgi:hypothetical protein
VIDPHFRQRQGRFGKMGKGRVPVFSGNTRLLVRNTRGSGRKSGAKGAKLPRISTNSDFLIVYEKGVWGLGSWVLGQGTGGWGPEAGAKPEAGNLPADQAGRNDGQGGLAGGLCRSSGVRLPADGGPCRTSGVRQHAVTFAPRRKPQT